MSYTPAFLNAYATRIDRTEGTPLYIQVHERLIEALSDDKAPATLYLPSERQLSDAFGVDRLTIRRALGLLQKQGLITKRAGARTVFNRVPKGSHGAQQTRNILFIMPRGRTADRITEPFNATLFHEAERRMRNSEYQLVYLTVSEEDTFDELLVSTSISGIIFVSEVSKALVKAARARSIPGVVVNTIDEDYPFVVGDRKHGMSEIVNYLITLGHRRIAFIGGIPGYHNSVLSESAFVHAMESCGCTVHQEYMKIGSWTFDGGYRATHELLAHATARPTAIVAANDAMALGAKEALENEGVEVPANVSITGYDNIEQHLHSAPKLTTVDLSLEAIASTMWRILEEQIAGESTINYKTVLPVSLVIRSSTAAPKTT